MRSNARLDEPAHFECVAVDEMDSAGPQVGDVESRAVRADADVLRNAAVRQGQVPENLASSPVDLHESARVLTRHDDVRAVDGEVGVIDATTLRRRYRTLQCHRFWITEIETLHRLGHDHGGLAV